jgi:hypothetical protein
VGRRGLRVDGWGDADNRCKEGCEELAAEGVAMLSHGCLDARLRTGLVVSSIDR